MSSINPEHHPGGEWLQAQGSKTPYLLLHKSITTPLLIFLDGGTYPTILPEKTLSQMG